MFGYHWIFEQCRFSGVHAFLRQIPKWQIQAWAKDVTQEIQAEDVEDEPVDNTYPKSS